MELGQLKTVRSIKVKRAVGKASELEIASLNNNGKRKKWIHPHLSLIGKKVRLQ
jgi:hypothetical protein